jgi:hypothetical protein
MEKQNMKNYEKNLKHVTVRLQPSLWTKSKYALMDKNLTFQKFFVAKLKEFIRESA